MRELEITCIADGCDRKANYRKVSLCQMHYFRKMRNGNFEKKLDIKKRIYGASRKYRTTNPAGYQKLFEPNHPLVNKNGEVYEHRFVVYEKYGNQLPACEMCAKDIAWSNCHIDHIDKDVSNNKIENLRPLCRGCNTSREYRTSAQSIEIDGVTKSIMQWARSSDCMVSATTIKRRLSCGYTPKDAVYAEKTTHKNVVSKKDNIKFNLNAGK